MNHIGRAAILLVLGVMTLRLIATGGFGWFVAQHMRLPLIGAGIVLLLLGVAEYYVSTRKSSTPAEPAAEAVTPGAALDIDTDAGESLWAGPVTTAIVADIDHHGTGDDHDKEHATAGPKVGWLLVLPLAVLIAVAPTALGAAAAGRVDAVIPTDSGTSFQPLPVQDVPVTMGVMEFLNRAVWDDQRSLEGVSVELTGIVVNDPEIPDGFKLTKFLVGCCAADGLPVQVVVRGLSQPMENDTWVEVAGQWIVPEVDAAESGDTPELMIESISVLPNAPSNPYESW